MNAETPEGVFARHRAIGAQVRAGIAALGLELFPHPSVASDTVTAVRVPSDVDASALLKDLRSRQIIVGSGQDWLKGSIFRIGHMGWVHAQDVENVLEGLQASLQVARRLDEAV